MFENVYSKEVAGIVVKLKSGGPRMTTCGDKNEKNDVKCCWFSDENTLQYAFFHVDALKTASDDVVSPNSGYERIRWWVGARVKISSSRTLMTVNSVDDKTGWLHLLWFVGSRLNRCMLPPNVVTVLSYGRPVPHGVDDEWLEENWASVYVCRGIKI